MTAVRLRLLRPVALAALGVAALAGCDRGADLGTSLDEPEAGTALVQASETYASGVTAAEQEAAVDRLQEVVSRLRADSTGGWQAIQDDVTGGAEELSGGRVAFAADPVGGATQFLERYGDAFAPVRPQLGDPVVNRDAGGTAVVSMPQLHGEVPVLDGSVQVTAASSGDTTEVTVVRGRVFDTSEVADAPTVSAAAATAIIRGATGLQPAGPPALVVFTEGNDPRLAWEATVTPRQDEPRGDTEQPTAEDATAQRTQVGAPETASAVFVDAVDGGVLGIRALAGERGIAMSHRQGTSAESVDLGNYNFELPPPGRRIKAGGTLPTGERVEVNAEQLADGSVILVDSSGRDANRETKKGVIAILDGRQMSPDSDRLPPVLRLPSATITDVDALAAAWGVRQSLDYFAREFGRLSFDGRNSPVPVIVHMPGSDGGCVNNAGFLTAPGESRMEVNDRCETNGKPDVHTMADLGTIGHELGHGILHTRIPTFRSTVQHGAIDEGTADYFGTVIENQVTGGNSTVASYFSCKGLQNDEYCYPQTRGQTGLRDVDAGATFDDYLFTIGEPWGIAEKLGDSGHGNSLVWSNALWSARELLTAMDDGDNNTSKKARAFDRAVYRATTLYLDGSSDMVDVAEAILRTAAQDDELGGRERDAIRRAFVQHKLCRNCQLPPRIARQVAGGASLQVRPYVTDQGVFFTQFSGRLSSTSVVQGSSGDRPRGVEGGDKLVFRAVAAGKHAASTVIEITAQGEIPSLVLRDLTTGAGRVLSQSPLDTVAPALSDEMVAFVEVQSDKTTVLRVLPLAGGTPRAMRMPQVPAHLAISGSRVAVQFRGGELAVWDTNGDRLVQVALAESPHGRGIALPAGGIALDGDRLAVLADPVGAQGPLDVITLSTGDRVRVSASASPFGLAFRDGLLIWAETTGKLPGKVAELVRGSIDTEIRAYSFTSNRFYRMVGQRGQQGFPSYDGNRLVWQDSVTGSDDVFAVTVPKGL